MGSRSGRKLVGEVLEDDIVEVSESVLDWRERRRNGIEGRRKVGKRLGVGWGSEGLRRKDIVDVVV
jgi:hypothetical protein